MTLEIGTKVLATLYGVSEPVPCTVVRMAGNADAILRINETVWAYRKGEKYPISLEKISLM